MADTLEDLLAQERRTEREWRSLQEVLNVVAALRADRPGGDTHGAAVRQRRLQARAWEVDRRRVEIGLRLAELRGQGTGLVQRGR
jgi:hypothetical protein